MEGQLASRRMERQRCRRAGLVSLKLALTLSAVAAVLYFISSAARTTLQYCSSGPYQRRQLFRLGQFKDPTTIEYKQPAHIAESDVNQQTAVRRVKQYSIESAILAIKSLRYQAFFFVYHSKKDEFIVIHNNEGCDFGCTRVYRIASIISFALRNNFPQRFNGTEDWVVVLSTGDVPRIHIHCLGGNHCGSEDFAPILQFGSVYDASMMPSAIAMPMPVKPHLPCFESWQQSVFRDKTPGRVCGYLLPEQIDEGLNDSETVGVQHGLMFAANASWDTLIPQVIWRGTDFVFLHTMFQSMRVPDFEADVKPKIASLQGEDVISKAAIRAVWELGDEVLLPRWRGVLLTSQAELEARELTNKQPNFEVLPWINIKFASSAINSKKVPASENPNFLNLQSVGISAIGEHISVQEQARYKYHIDLGGGGGTTWTGTIEKLAMPGVLFHHVTPTSDYFYNRLLPWVHFIPVRADLSDLRERYEWAENNPEEAQKIARAGTEFAKWIGTVDGFRTMYQEYLVDPLKASLDAYVPMDKKLFGSKTVMDIIDEQGESSWHIVAICSGLHADSCRDLNGEYVA
ncbi:hypothetical protein ACHAXN_006045 [Cyclotella atomus]